MWRDRVAAKYGVQSDAVDEIELVNPKSHQARVKKSYPGTGCRNPRLAMTAANPRRSR